jgi:hypothetical protein
MMSAGVTSRTIADAHRACLRSPLRPLEDLGQTPDPLNAEPSKTRSADNIRRGGGAAAKGGSAIAAVIRAGFSALRPLA